MGRTLRFQRQVSNCGANGAILGQGGMGREGGVRSLRLEVARALKGCTSSAPRGAKPSKTGRRDRASDGTQLVLALARGLSLD